MKGRLTLPKNPGDAFRQAYRYFENAKELLRKTPIEYGIYKDEKYVKEASAMAYLASLRAIDGCLLHKGVSTDKLPASITEYEKALQRIPHNGKLFAAMTIVYQNLHIFGYYRGGVDVEMIKSGLNSVKLIINALSRRKG